MQYTRSIVPALILAGLLTGCGLPAQPSAAAVGTPSQPAYQTVAVMLSETAQMGVTPESTASPEPTQQMETPQPSSTSTVPPVSASATPLPDTSATPETLCNLAQAGIPIDVTIPDDTTMQPGQQFTKTWRLVNAGSCAWSREYALVWFSGDDLGSRREEFLRAAVQPGETVELSVDMTAPGQGGVYQSNWKLRNPAGSLFGIGPGGGAPFWVRIQVLVPATITPTPTATSEAAPTETVEVINDGFVTLMAPQAFDLESALTDTEFEDDLSLILVDGNMVLEPVNGAEMADFGTNTPSVSACQAAQTSTGTLQLGSGLTGRYLCVRTNLGLTAYVQLTRIDTVGSEVDMNFVTWAE